MDSLNTGAAILNTEKDLDNPICVLRIHPEQTNVTYQHSFCHYTDSTRSYMQVTETNRMKKSAIQRFPVENSLGTWFGLLGGGAA